MLPGGPLLPSILPFRFVPRGKIHFPIVASLWQSSDKVKKFYCDFLRLDTLRGLGILVSVRFDYQTNGISRYRTFCVYSV